MCYSTAFLQQQKQAISFLKSFLYAPYAIWPIGLSSSMPGAKKFVRGSPVSLAAEQRAIVGELKSHNTSASFNLDSVWGGGGTDLLEMTSVK